MKRFLLLSSLFVLCFPIVCKAQDNRLSFGAEWGTEILYVSYIDYNYIGEDGSNVSENSINWQMPHVNGFAEAKIGINATNKLNISILAGVKGLGKNNVLLPVELRLSFLPKGMDNNGFLLSGGGGINFGMVQGLKLQSESAVLLAGFHHPLQGGMSLDLFGGLRVSTDHPRIYDSTAGRYVPEKDIRKNDALYGSIVFGLTLNLR